MPDKRRYPGISPFSEEQKELFFGRDKDIKKLLRLIKLRKQVLLYSKSGVGKTSLLNAGVFPLIKDDFIIIKIRFLAYNPKDETIIPPSERIINALHSNFTKLAEEKTIIDEIDTEKNLWFWIKKIQILKENKAVILAFDQFEELFSYPEQMIEDFKTQIQQVLNSKIPGEILSFIEDNPEKEEQTDILYENIDVKTVYAIRSDRLSLLNRLTDKIPDIQSNFYELLPLTREQAKEAVLKPAIAKGEFDSPNFNFDETALQKVLDVLTDKHSLTVETTQLQIVCQRIENVAIDKKKNSPPEAEIIIYKNDLPEFKDIFVDFYYETLNKIPEQNRQKVAILIEDNLIINEQRITLHEAVCKQYATESDLRILTNTHLLRAENISTGFAYELSHDTLVEPILEVRKKRKEEEARLEEERKQQEELQRLQQQRRRQRTIITIIGIAAVISVAFAVFGLWQMNKAKEALKNAVNFQVRGKKKDAIQFKEQEKYNAAIGKYYELLEIYRQYPQFRFDTNAVYEDINECYHLDSTSKKFYAFMDKADSLIVLNDVKTTKKALEYYLKADSLKYPHSEKRFETFKIKLQQTKESLEQQKKTALEAGGIGQNIAQQIDEVLRMMENVP